MAKAGIFAGMLKKCVPRGCCVHKIRGQKLYDWATWLYNLIPVLVQLYNISDPTHMKNNPAYGFNNYLYLQLMYFSISGLLNYCNLRFCIVLLSQIWFCL